MLSTKDLIPHSNFFSKQKSLQEIFEEEERCRENAEYWMNRAFEEYQAANESLLKAQSYLSKIKK